MAQQPRRNASSLVQPQPRLQAQQRNAQQAQAQQASSGRPQSHTQSEKHGTTLSHSRAWFARGTKFCKAGLKRMFDAAAASDGQKGVRNLRACILREMKLAVKGTQEVVLSEWEVFEMMKAPESDRCTSCYASLDCDAVDDEEHASGWTISGELQYERFCLCTEFKARHRTMGSVWSDTTMHPDACIKASSRRALDHFWANHGSQFSVVDLYDFE